MYSETDIDGAVQAGVLGADAAEALRVHVAGQRATPLVDEESFRLLTGFNDIFVSIAAVLLLVAMGWIGNSIRIGAAVEGPSPLLGFAVAGTAWVLAEYFTKVRRMALPSIILLLAFAGGLFVGFGTSFVGRADFEHDSASALLLAVAAALTAGGVWLHWRRFQVPITVAAGAAALAGLIVLLLIGSVPVLQDHVSPILFACGLAVFALAMAWDMSDPKRLTRRSDVAFWLHLLAAPMIVHPVFDMMGMLHGTADPVKASIVILLYVGLGIVALAIDRRALMVSALAYVLFALTSLMEQAGAVNLSFGFTALIIGSVLLLLSAFWQSARRFVVGLLPSVMSARLPLVGAPVLG